MASTSYVLSSFWEALNGTKWEPQVTFERKNPIPLDKYSVFPALSSAEAFALSSGVAYPGQIISVVDNATSAISTYKIEVGGALTQIDAATVYTTEATPTISSNIDENLKITSEIVSASIQPKHIDTNEVWYFDSNYAD